MPVMTPRYDPTQSRKAREQEQKSVLINALKPLLGFGTCVVKTTATAPLEVTKWLLEKKSS